MSKIHYTEKSFKHDLKSILWFLYGDDGLHLYHKEASTPEGYDKLVKEVLSQQGKQRIANVLLGQVGRLTKNYPWAF